MTGDQYVSMVLSRYIVPRGPFSPTARTAALLLPSLRQWADRYLAGPVQFSGSYAKGTGVAGSTDIDLFIPLKSNTPHTLKDIHDNLFSWAQAAGWSPKRQDVSIGVTYQRREIDLVPAKRQPGFLRYHSLYRKSGTWTQTNIAKHIQVVSTSGRIQEIRAIKVWRNLFGIDFASFYLELAVIRALSGRPIGRLADNVFHALRHIGVHLPAMRIVDPSNTNNIISDDYTSAEKQAIATAARTAGQQASWRSILW